MSLVLRSARALALATVAVSLSTATLVAQAVPTVQQIHDRYVEAVGGRAAWARHTSFTSKSTITLGAMGTATSEGTLARPNLMLFKLVAPFGEILQGHDGTTVWSVNPMQGPQIVEGKAADAIRQAGTWALMTYEPGSYTSATVVGPADFEGAKAWQVKMQPIVGPEVTEYFDQATGLKLGAVAKSETPMGEIEARTVFREYTAYGDLKMPRIVVQSNPMMGELVSTIESVEYDKAPPSAFELPAAVKALKK
ncbi:MAG: hypothetical protein MUF21_10210 [Gemmatimonadaceae bacterium]|nr:hypothetical protein [Gemmatimonadaceae bacterium]